jgi:Virulence-associated protein E-like domain
MAAGRGGMNVNPNIKRAINAHAIPLTFFENEFASSLKTNRLTLPEMREMILRAKASTKSKLGWLKLAQFGKVQSTKEDGTPGNCLRHDANATGFSGIELDYDGEVIGFEEAVGRLQALNVRFLIYTSPSHTVAKPRWRILLPVSRLDLSAEMRGKLCARINGAMGCIFARETFVLSQSYFYGRALDNPAPDHRCEVIDGRLIDLCDDLYKFEKDGMPPTAEAGTGANEPKFTNGVIDWAMVAEHADWLKRATDLPDDFSAKGKLIVGHAGNLQELKFDLDQAGLIVSKPYQTWSEVAFALAAIFKADKRHSNEQIAAALLCDLACNQHIRKQKDQRRAIERLISRCYQQADTNAKKARPAGEPDWRERRENGSPVPSLHNARLAITAFGIECSYDTFHNKMVFNGDSISGEIDDNFVLHLRRQLSDQFGFDLTERHARDALASLALDHQFDPVCDMLAEAEKNWDGVKRLNRMAADHLNCEDTLLNAMFVRKMMIAAVARPRHPGIKFDTIATFESPEGFNKTSSIIVLAGEENFSDESIIGKGTQAVQETLAGCWIHENSELHGMKKAEVEHVKSFASRTSDDCRPAYGHFVKKQKRHSIEVATTNSNQYLQSQTGNRRFWPMRVIASIDLEKLKADRLQLWGEAAHHESQGESLVLPEDMWAAAGVEQEARRIDDPWEQELSDIENGVLIEFRDKDTGEVVSSKTITIVFTFPDEHPAQKRVAAADILHHVLRIPVERQSVQAAMRLSTAMTKLGWERHANGVVRIGGKLVTGYFRPLSDIPF